jgi:hypothetical protein
MQKNPSSLLLALAGVTALSACPVDDTPTPENADCEDGVCTLTGEILEDTTLTADQTWLLRGGVFVGNDTDPVTLTIEPGTTVFGDTAELSFLVVTRNSKIVADGTADAPIVFTSAKEDGSRGRGDWGGLIINGNATVNGCDAPPCESFGEGGTGFYGADNDDDDSGVLRYVRVEFAGRLISPDNELNAVAFQGVGRGTTVDFVQAHMGSDDGFEFFGGTVNAKHLVATGISDDNIDWTDGWRGNLQYAVAQQYADAGDQGIEADNNAENNASAPRSNPTLSNITLIGSPDSTNSDIGMLLREGTAASIHNAVVVGFNERCFDIDQAETFAQAAAGDLVIENSIFSCATLSIPADDGTDPIVLDDFLLVDQTGNVSGDPGLKQPFNTTAPDFGATAAGAAGSGAVVPADAFFDDVAFKGGVGPDVDWTAGWTAYPAN